MAVFSLGPFSIVPPMPLQPYFFDVATKMIDVVTNSTQTPENNPLSVNVMHWHIGNLHVL